ncbi:CHAT domain-containing protein [Streptomyces sp. GS7]|uniref:CHAT domain-containing protein n=1 Tax=Streptomyces sp. GS7 TaxID=2692234 RepID=UPI001319B7F6|nr:CHAT domain-containing protein [Streptomyces sp. GS7]QHC23454.1 CHAT domain-containing protein [Streptomyces sp. GS7]
MASELSELLRRLRRRAGMTQEELAERSGVGVRSIRGLETGERSDPRVTTVRLLADALELGPEEREELLSAAVRRSSDSDPGNRYAQVGYARWDEPAGGRPGPSEPGSASSAPLADIAKQLAGMVASRWWHEQELLQGEDPFPLPVRWQRASGELTDDRANIRRLPPGSVAGLMDLSGRLDDVAEVYRRIPSGRLVVLGRPGSGKSVLAVRFARRYLASRDGRDPVPVIFSIGGWNPAAVTLTEWLTGQLACDYPNLAVPGPGGASMAAMLIEDDRVLPVLDGFDEIADGLRRRALEELNTTTLPLLLTSRPAEYAAAVAESDVLTCAAAIELIDLTLEDLAHYLPRTTYKASGASSASHVWDPVLAELLKRGRSRSGANLAAVLTTPLMVALARILYSEVPERDPSELLDTARFPTPEALEEHLLDAVVPAAYRRSSGERSRGRRRQRHWDPERAQHWLGYLATHMSSLATPDLEWWRLGTTVNRFSRLFVLGVLTALAVGTTTALVSIPVDLVSASHGLGSALERGLAVGLAAGLACVILYGAGYPEGAGEAEPSRLRVPIFGRRREIRRRLLPRFGLGLVFGLLAALTLALAGVMVAGLGLDGGLAGSLVFVPGVGLGTGLLLGLMTLLEEPDDTRSAASPTDLLNTSRRNAVFQLLSWALLFMLVAGIVNRFTAWHGYGISAALEATFGLGLGYRISLTAWGQWVALVRIWLPLTGRVPWALIAFLDDACQRGVLRRTGADYQFRHPRLQHHLAQTSGCEAEPAPGLHAELNDLPPVETAPSNPSAGAERRVVRVYSRAGGRGGQHRREGGDSERHRLVAELAEHTAPGKEVPLQVQIVTGGGSRGALLREFHVPDTGARLLITVHAPALVITSELQQEVTVLPRQDSDVLHFGIRANQPGLHEVTVRAFRKGTFLGEVRCQISVEAGGTTRGGPPHSTDLETLAFDPGEVTLQVLRSGPGAFTFQLLSETCYAPETFQAGHPHEAATRIFHALKEAAAKAGQVDAAFLRSRLRAHGVQLWTSAVPQTVQHQFWEQSRRITSFTILGEHDVIPWELLYPLNEGHDQGFLAEWLPVVRRVFGQDRVRELALGKMTFVVPPGSPTHALQEVRALRARFGPGLEDLGVLKRREALTNLIEVGLGGLLHFACHNTFTAAGSQVSMADGPFAPIDLAVAAQLRSLRAEHPLVFFNACRSAGEIDWFGETLGWAPQFLRAGAGAFIGTLWPVRSQSALDFADAFYEQLITHRRPLGQASLQARQSIRGQDGDPTWLAYAVYGSPAAAAHTPI